MDSSQTCYEHVLGPITWHYKKEYDENWMKLTKITFEAGKRHGEPRMEVDYDDLCSYDFPPYR